ncbi:hypothetical protein IB278_24220 [Variovorax sp. VRV01]|uniref:hypothetical protein n=1 Tax=Variovorax sp. VRV01 TaxID=2769259 RepID=UPI00177D95C7|nr:hypothetical protein [Variovorax sp. VRV01]MBD9667090.1 hypothetical protein [Variovorax sp. VRV01]
MKNNTEQSPADGSRGPHKNKRPLFFISGEDFYFVAYSILLVLQYLGGSARRVKDHRKIAYLIQFLGDSRLIDLLERTQGVGVANAIDRELLFSSYTSAELHKREVFKIIFSMERRGFLRMQRTDSPEMLDITLISDGVPQGFFESDSFTDERANAEKLRKLVPRLSLLTFESLLDRLYKDRGVRVWAS